MSLEKKVLGGIFIAGSFMVLCMTAAKETKAVETVQASVAAAHTEQKTNTKNTDMRAAGVNAFLTQKEQELQKADVQQTKQDIVTTAKEAEVTGEEQVWQDRLLADVKDFLYIRMAGNEDAEVVGKLYKGDLAQIVETGDTWTHIVSGDVDGYVKNEYCVSGLEAMTYANENFDKTAEIQANGLWIRSEANAESDALTIASSGTILVVDESVETTDEWVAVKYNNDTAYVSAEFVMTDVALGEAITIEEDREIEAAAAQARAEAAAAAAEKAAAEAAANPVSVEVVQNEAVSASYDDVTLLAALIQCEAGGECYEGQVAVGAVVMNRVRSGGYANNIYDVIYQPYQFTPAGRGDVAVVAAAGPKASCIQAAQEALNGVDNTGGATCFRRVSSGRPGYVIGNHVFW